ncbi:hypothetical protein Huta_1840 [Halorhabdus utahensis DSM 12940]|uniref:Uncharacterized protein n=1 Tax=Halorhabdus utahensis (strain DSM 12940 / JCM 11049 / AX-2) TaxID=519442 RepID=C7NSC3_HALUD|nr:hypothetical protein Huta_1840 [Halorhabdus utahensis DSM 12940]
MIGLGKRFILVLLDLQGVYLYTPDGIDRKRAHHQAVKQEADDVPTKRRGNLGELAFEQFCREYLPVEMWEWKNEQPLRKCNPESYAAYDFEVFGYEVDVKTSRDVSAFRPSHLLDQDPDDDIIVMVWHRDNEDGLILLGWERVETLESKVTTQESYSGTEPEKLDHLSSRPMNELMDLGPNTAHMNQKPENPFSPGDRVVKAADSDASVAVVVEVLPPETEVGIYGQSMDGEAVRVAFPSTLDEGPGDWRDIDAALLSSYCDDQDLKLYTYKHTNLDFAENPFVPGDRVVNANHDDPDEAVVVSRTDSSSEKAVTVVYATQLEDDQIPPAALSTHAEKHQLKQYSYNVDVLEGA